jgi:hypothetical protein
VKSKSWIHFLFLLLRNLSHMYIKISSSLDDVMSSTREDVIRRRHVLLRCAAALRMQSSRIWCRIAW